MIALVEVRPFGRADVIGSVGHVETTFMSVARLPILPLRSYFVVERTGEVIAIPFHVRSALLAYLRLVTCVVGIACIAAGLFVPLASAASGQVAIGLAVGLGFVIVGALVAASTWLLQPRLQRAAPDRRERLLAHLHDHGA